MIRTRTVLNTLLVIEITLSSFSLFLDSSTGNDISSDLIVPGFLLSLIVLVFWLIGIVGLFMLKNWGRVCYGLCILFSLPLAVFLFSQFAWTGLETISIAVTLLILYVIFASNLAPEFN